MANNSQHGNWQQPEDGEIIPITQGADGRQAVSGRALHEFLGIGKRYTTWLADMIEYGFTAGQDFLPISGETSAAGGRPRQDHALTLEMAKELSMIQRTDRGKQARKYFIAVEKRAQSQVGAPESMAGMIRTLAATLLSIVDNAEPAPTAKSAPVFPEGPQGSLFEVEPPRRAVTHTPSTFFISDYVDEYNLDPETSQLAARSLALAASNEYERQHGERPPRTSRYIMGRKTFGNAYTDADRPMLDALWNRGFRHIGGAA